jgi:prephenate dehydratase
MPRHVAYQGAPGAFGEEACRAFLPDWLPVARPTFAAVLDSVRAGEADRGILPLRNSSAGPVPGVEELIGGSGLLVLERRSLPVRLHLLALPDARPEAIRRVASHPMALAQCRKWLDESGLAVEEEANTAVAARALAESGDLEKAVMASEMAAKAYGLAIVRRDLQDSADNATIFVVVARDPEER